VEVIMEEEDHPAEDHLEDHLEDLSEVADSTEAVADHLEDHPEDHPEDHLEDHLEDHPEDHPEDHLEDHPEDHPEDHLEDHLEDHRSHSTPRQAAAIRVDPDTQEEEEDHPEVVEAAEAVDPPDRVVFRTGDYLSWRSGTVLSRRIQAYIRIYPPLLNSMSMKGPTWQLLDYRVHRKS
jgi:hypothetical protein